MEIKQPIITTEKVYNSETGAPGTICIITNPYAYGNLYYKRSSKSFEDPDTTWQVKSNVGKITFMMENPIEYVEAYIDLEITSHIATVKQLTESDKTVSYRIVSVLKRDSNPETYLKAFVNIKPSDTRYNVCIWEKTYNGVDWEEVPEFTKYGNLIYLDVVDDSQISTDLEGSSIKKKTKKFKKFNPKNQTEALFQRPDCLKLDTIDTATYKFSLYALDNFREDLAFYDVKRYVRASYPSTDWVLIDTPTNNVYTITEYTNNLNKLHSRYFKLQFHLSFPQTAKNLDFSKFTVKILKDKTHSFLAKNVTVSLDNDILTIFVENFDKVSLGENFYKSIPTLIKIYYENKLFYSLKEVYNLMFDHTIISLGYSYVKDIPQVIIESTGIKEGADKETYINTPTNDNLLEPLQRKIIDTSFIYEGLGRVKFTEVNVYAYITDLLGFKFNVEETSGDKIPNVAMSFTMGSFETKGIDYDLKYLQRYEQTYSSVYDAYYSLGIGTGQTPENAARHASFEFVTDFTYSIIFETSDNNQIIIKQLIKKTRDTWTYDDYFYYKNNKEVSQGLPELYENVNVVDEDAYDEEEIFKITTILNSKEFSFTFDKTSEVSTYEYANSVLGDKLLHKKSIYSYGIPEFKSNIFVSDTDSFNTPLFNLIDLSASNDSQVNVLISWRDYLIAATDSTIYLISKTEEGFFTKTVNTFIGISEKDSKTCKSILNGIIFKSGTKIYVLQPNAASSDDSILNISEISKPIEEYVIRSSPYNNYAFTTETAYYLFMPQEDRTIMLKYEYGTRIWTKFEYPVALIDYEILSVDDIRLYSNTGYEYAFNKELKDVAYDILSKEDLDAIPYGDVLDTDLKELPNWELHPEYISPISFYVRSGQKTDNISYTKQFVESKLILATLHDKDSFTINLSILIDGALHSNHTSAYTDGALVKNNLDDSYVLNTLGYANNAQMFNVLRQMFVRYSGKGKSIEHVIQGKSVYNFKLYVVYYRYKLLNIKQ